MPEITPAHPANIFKFCPKCGKDGFTFDGVKAFDCHHCHFRFYINASTAVAVILELPSGEIILTKRKNEPKAGFYDLPGGFVDLGESAEDAAIRELQEELGIQVNNLRFIASFPNEYIFRGITYYTTDISFVASIPQDIQLKPADDVAEALVIKPEDIDFNIISFPSIVNVLKEYKKSLKNSVIF